MRGTAANARVGAITLGIGVGALFDELSQLPNVKIARPICPQEYGQIEFDIFDLNGYRLVFAQPTS